VKRGLSLTAFGLILFGLQPKEKTPVLSHQGFFFVAECNEISDLRLEEDIYNILEFLDSEIALEEPLMLSY
jgi:hypothetical protein